MTKSSRMKSLTAGLISVGCLLAAGRADAHFSLDFPKGRSGEIDSKPCGGTGSMRGSTVSTFHPGDKIKLQWNVFVQHTTPGLWRLSIDDSGQDFPDPVAPNDTSKLPLFIDHFEASGVTMQEMEVTIPNIECDKCTVQLLQYKYDKPPYSDPSSFYYQCADIVITSDPNVPTSGGASQTGGSPQMSGGASQTGGSPPMSGGGSGAPAKAGTGGGGSDGDSGGCSLVSRGTAGGTARAWIALALLASASTLRRARRTRS
jgi:hypothetical protein